MLFSYAGVAVLICYSCILQPNIPDIPNPSPTIPHVLPWSSPAWSLSIRIQGYGEVEPLSRGVINQNSRQDTHGVNNGDMRHI